MKYAANTKPGMGDPYWYEWSVGLQYIIEMLNPDSHIEYVELQADVPLGLDDVVVTYDDGTKTFVQVKHTRTEDSLTFGDLVSKDSSGGRSLLQNLAMGWNGEKGKYNHTDVLLFTNRSAGKNVASTRTVVPFRRPALATFLLELKEKVESAKTFEDILFPDYVEAWNEWVNQLDSIADSADKLLFLKCLRIDTNNSGLSSLQDNLLNKLKELFQTNDAIAAELLKSLDHALRYWSTSNRETSRIDKEEVYRKLSVIQEFSSYNQDLVPSDPFFPSRETLVQLIEKELQSNRHKIVFLSGIPGIGKTNIISKLNAKRESLIDIRYYAYEPIDPTKEYFTGDVCRRVDKEYFWNELFNQLRRLLKGQLYKYNVPVINDLMTLEQKRENFFRIASNFATDRGRSFVVAIDGIDHAARAICIDNTFLPTLPNPEFLPSNVEIILAGQPKADYRNYPDWLFINTKDIVEINVPPLQIEDIQSLVNTRFLEKSSAYKTQLSELIEKYAEGNTLAAVFAVYEAMREPVLFKLEKALQDRKLSGNIHEYYRTIWNNAIQRIPSPYVDYKVAGVFAFLNEPIDEKKLHSIYHDELLSVSDWRNVLKDLHPLLSEESGNYTILHNDVRVFLSSIIGQDQDHVREVYGNLADYYLALPNKNEAYYHDIFRFMKASKRLSEFRRVFSPEFIIASYVNGVKIDEIYEITSDILKEISGNIPIDWTQMRSLAFGYLTIDQLEKVQYEIDSISFCKQNKDIPIHPFECYVEPLSVWNNALITDVLSLIEKLYDEGLTRRANTLFKRWFSGMSIVDIYDKVVTQEDSYFLSSSTQKIASCLAVAACRSEEFSILSGTKKLETKDSSFQFHLMNSAFETIIKEYTGDVLSSSLSKLEVYYYKSILNGLLVLLSDNRLGDIYSIATILNDHFSETPIETLLSTIYNILSMKADYTQERKEELWEIIESTDFSQISYENEIAYFSIYAIAAAYLQSKPYSVVAHDVLEKFIEKNSYKDRTYFGVYFNNICLIGEWLSKRQKHSAILIRTKDLQSMIHALFLKKWSPGIIDSEICKLRAHVLKAYIFLSRNSDAQIRMVIDDACEQVFADNPVYYLLDAGFYYYVNNEFRKRQWYEEWLGNKGRVWMEPISERNRIIQDFLHVLSLYDTNRNIDVTEALEKARWSVIGYVSHKEYTCDYLLKWYNELVDKQDSVDPNLAKQIKKISDQMEELGDNRLEYHINCRIFGDLFSCGFQTIKNTLQDNHYLCQGIESPGYLVDGLIGYLKKGIFDQEALLKVWAMGMSVVNWKKEAEHATIHSLQKAIEMCAERSGVHGIHTMLQKYGPAYINLAADSVRYIIPERWCDESRNGKSDLVSDALILAYLNGEKVKKDSLVAGIDALISQGKISNELLIRLLTFELEKEEYEIDHNPIITCLFKQLPSISTDPIVAQYIDGLIEKDHHYLEAQLPVFVRWKICQQDDMYGKDGVNELINMHRVWMTSAGHFQEPAIIDNVDYSSMIDWEKTVDIYSLFYQILKIIILSEDADAVRTALSGIFALQRMDKSFINWIEGDWSSFHYRAKEWLLMTYELLWDIEQDKRDDVRRCIETHCSDEDFNVALYANLLLENIQSDGNHSYKKVVQPYFSSIPNFGIRRLVKATQGGPCVTGANYVEKTLFYLGELTGEDCSDIEKRTVAYSEFINKDLSLIPLNQHRNGGYKVTCDKTVFSFLRVLYKDWVAGRWDGLEAQIARVFLSASEPFTLLTTPSLWKYNDHLLIRDTCDFVKQPEIIRKKVIKEIIETGIQDDEKILAGSVRDYTHDNEIFGFILSYLEIPGMTLAYGASSKVERNSRYFLQRRMDFFEDNHINLSLHYVGIESFKDSGISCGISKTALNSFGWSIDISPEGPILLNSKGERIGRFESYYAYRDISNRYPSNQPYLQRWIINQKELSNLKPWSVNTVVGIESYKLG